MQGPPGQEIPGKGGAWKYCRDSKGARFIVQLDGFLNHLTRNASDTLREDLLRKMRRAAEGKLSYGPGPEHDVEQTARCPSVLELRLVTISPDLDPATGQELRRQTRLYFTEPLSYAGELWAATIRSKFPDTPDWKQEQNNHIDEANDLVHAFEVYRLRKKL